MSDRHAAPADLPLFRWGAELRRARAERRRLWLRLAIGVAGIAILGATIASSPRPRLLWNASASAPIGLYRVTSGAAPRVGDMVAAYPPRPMRELAAERHYLPRNVPLVKRVVATESDFVCGAGEAVYVNEKPAALRLARDGKGRPMPWWTGCQTLARGEYLLLMDDVPASFDGRYFGPVSSEQIVGKAVLLWRR